MHWVIQDNLYNEAGYGRLITALERQGVPHSFVKVVPFSHELIPDIDLPNPVIVCGALTMGEIAARKGWRPGAFTNANFDFAVWHEHWGEHCLNHDARVVAFKDVQNWDDKFFMRPTEDTKSFSGGTFTWTEFAEWRDKVNALGKDEYSTLTPETMVLVSPLKEIYNERRYFIVEGEIVTSSQYKLGGRIIYNAMPDPEADAFVAEMIRLWTPHLAFVLDVGLTPDGFRVIEINCINSAGFYEADCSKLVGALEGMGFDEFYQRLARLQATEK